MTQWKKQKHSIKDNTTKSRSKTDHSAHKIGECQNKTGTKQTEYIKKRRLDIKGNTETKLDRTRHQHHHLKSIEMATILNKILGLISEYESVKYKQQIHE